MKREDIAQLYARYGAVVHRRCRYVLRDEEAARDATQEVFVKVMGAIDTFRSDASPLTWIMRIATNYCLNVLAAKNAGWHERYRNHVLREEPRTADTGGDLERAEEVRRLLSRVDAETAQVAIHYYVDEMTQDEIALAIDRSLPTIRKRLAKFIRVAQKELRDEPALAR